MSDKLNTIQFSVVIAAHNSAQWLGAALDSVGRQTLPPLEVWVFNDSSQDSLASIQARHPSVHFKEVNHRNAAATRNEALNLVKGDYIAFLDSDDVWQESHLARAAEQIKFSPGAVGYINAFDYLGLDGRQIYKPVTWGITLPKAMRATDYIQFLERNKYFVGMSACIVKTQRFREIGGFDPAFLRRHDIEMWLRLIVNELLVVDPVKTSLYRRNVPSSLSSGTWETEYFKFKGFKKNRALYSGVPAYSKLMERSASVAVHNSIVHGSAETRQKTFKETSPFILWPVRAALFLGILFPGIYSGLYKLIR